MCPICKLELHCRVAALFLGMYAGISRLLDMAYTPLNVAGDVTANVLIDRWEKKR